MQFKKPDLVKLDERILFDVAPLDVQGFDLQEADMADDYGAAESEAFDWTEAPGPSPWLEEAVDVQTIDERYSEQLNQLSSLLADNLEDQALGLKQLIVIDQNVDDFSTLLDMAMGDADPGNYEILLVDPSESALDRISQRLNSTDYAAIHIVAHGQDGQIHLGGETWDTEFLTTNELPLSQWQQSLTADADIFLYGCDLAASELGKEFAQQLAEITGADVAASVNTTGSAVLGGDWNLEYEVGSIDQPQSLFVENNVNDWTYTLMVPIPVPVNQAPDAVDDKYFLFEGGDVSVTTSVFDNDIDKDGDALVVGTLVKGPEHGTLLWNNDGTFYYLHDGSENHLDQFYYSVSDGNGGSSIGTVTLDVSPMNDAPVAYGEKMVASNLVPLVVTAEDLLANDIDADGDRLIVYIVRGPRNGTIKIVDNQLIYTADMGYEGRDRIRYLVFDGESISNIVSLKINVKAMAPAPPEAEEVPEDDGETGPDESSESSAMDGNDGPQFDPPDTTDTDNERENRRNQDSSRNIAELPSDRFDKRAYPGLNLSIVDKNELDLESIRHMSKDDRSSFTSSTRLASYKTSSFVASSEATTNPHDTYIHSVESIDYSNSVIFDNMSRELDSFDRDFKMDGSVDQVTYATLSSITSVLTVGYVMWMVRGGMLMASFVSSLPAWQSVDPLNVVAFGTEFDTEADGESLESIVNQFSTDA